MDSAKQIVTYLEELACVLAEMGVNEPFHLVITGGAYMLLQRQRRSTEDIDFARIARPRKPAKPNKLFMTTVLRGELASLTNSVQFAEEFREAVAVVAHHRRLPGDWLNDESAVYYYDDAPQVEVSFWREFGGLLYVYLPSMEYILATKIAAWRPKDEDDIRVLLRELGVRTWEQAKIVVNKFLLPSAQEFWEVDDHLDILFP
jgi:DNA-directed RNA polymerase subunit F